MAAAEHESDFELTEQPIPFTLRGELWGVYCEDLGENGLRYNDTALYYLVMHWS